MEEIMLAPLHEVNCLSYRMLCRKCGADTVYTPMINTSSYIRNPEIHKWLNKEKPLVVQLIGSKIEEFEECCKVIKNCSYIDLNAGCPSLDNTKNGAGAALLKDLENFSAIIKTMAKYSSVPVSVKIRLGWKKNEAVKIAKIAEKAGASRIAIHGRAFGENYSKPADWKAIREVKKAISIPVIANGDIDSGIKAAECLKVTNADALMIGREAMKNPFIFQDIKEYLKSGEILKHSKDERTKLILDYAKLYKKTETYNNAELKNHCIWMCNGFKGSSIVRNDLGKCKSYEKIITEIKNCSYLKI